MSDFFKKDGIIKRGQFFRNDNHIKPRTVVVLLKDGTTRQHEGIKDPWRYIAACKKNPDVKNAWIKNE